MNMYILVLWFFVTISYTYSSIIQETIEEMKVCEGATVVYKYDGPILADRFSGVDHIHILLSNITIGIDKHLSFPQLSNLAIEHSDVNGVLKNFWKALPNIEKLVIDDSYIENFSIKDLDSLPNLQSLTIKRIENLQLEASCFGNLKKLKYLSLSYSIGNISINSGAFEGLQNLEVLNLNYDDLEKLPKEMLVPLKQLRRLGLGGNQLKILDIEQICEIKNLEEIDISDNKIYSEDIRELSTKCNKLKIITDE